MRGLTKAVREAAASLEKFASSDVVNKLDVKTYVDARKVRNTIQELRRSGEIISIDRGVYVYRGREKRRTKLDVVWHLVRSYRQFDTDEIERLSGARRATVLEYLHCLRMLGYLRQVRRGYWQLVNDPGPQTPVNTSKCQRLRKLREEKNEKGQDEF